MNFLGFFNSMEYKDQVMFCDAINNKNLDEINKYIYLDYIWDDFQTYYVDIWGEYICRINTLIALAFIDDNLNFEVALLHSIITHNLDIVKYLLTTYTLVNKEWMYKTTMEWSTRYENLEVIKYIFSCKTFLNEYGELALERSIVFDNFHIVKYLISLGVNYENIRSNISSEQYDKLMELL